jgi:UDP-N-acetylglucosamine acyltransferase
MIHPTAIVHPAAQIGANCEIGPYCVIDSEVQLGPGCSLAPHVVLIGKITLGSNNSLHAGVVIGDLPQDLRFKGDQTAVVIGSDNVIREHATVHRSNNPSEPTRLGSNNFLMAHSHIGHNTLVGDHCIIANGALLGGHSVVEDRAFLSGNCLVHQFVRVGTLALMQGGSAVSKDLPPFTISRGDNSISGLNIIGLRRAGISPEERLELKRLYHFLFLSGRSVRRAAEEAQAQFAGPSAKAMIRFVLESKRGVLTPRNRFVRRCGTPETTDNTMEEE